MHGDCDRTATGNTKIASSKSIKSAITNRGARVAERGAATGSWREQHARKSLWAKALRSLDSFIAQGLSTLCQTATGFVASPTALPPPSVSSTTFSTLFSTRQPGHRTYRV